MGLPNILETDVVAVGLLLLLPGNIVAGPAVGFASDSFVVAWIVVVPVGSKDSASVLGLIAGCDACGCSLTGSVLSPVRRTIRSGVCGGSSGVSEAMRVMACAFVFDALWWGVGTSELWMFCMYEDV